MFITTDAIESDGTIDSRYTCDLDNSSPELRWRDVPMDAAGFVLLADDPHGASGAFTHWVVYNIPPHIHHLPAGIPAQETLPNGIRQGINGYGKLGYSGPCPAVGERARTYVFRLFALRAVPDLPSRATREQVMAAISPFVIESAEVSGRYQRALQRAG
jgi:Raf kinase inhibitor-like YbhB/YbcL family protein